MAKIRGIKPEFWTDEDIVELSLPARLLFIGLWNLACDNGHVTDKPKQIKMRLLPADDVNVDKLLDELVTKGRIERSDGTITVRNFAKHQKPHRRWWSTCDLPLCNVPEDAPEQGYNRGEGTSQTSSQRGNNRGATVDHGRTTADVDGEGDVDSDVEGEGEGRSATSARKRAHQLPSDFEPNDTNRRIASDRGVDLRAAFENFADHHRAKGTTYKDWHLAFNTWLRRERPSVHPIRPTYRPPEAHELEQPPDGLSPAEYAEWDRKQRAKRANA